MTKLQLILNFEYLKGLTEKWHKGCHSVEQTGF